MANPYGLHGPGDDNDYQHPKSMRTEPEIRGHEQRAKLDAAHNTARNTRDLPSRIADPDRLRALAEEMRAIAERPSTTEGMSAAGQNDVAAALLPGILDLIMLHEEKHRRVVVHMATVLEACALRIQELEAAVAGAVPGAAEGGIVGAL
jgi:hypothetical protein